MRVVVIGGGGFIGGYLVRALLTAGHAVTIAGRRPRHLAGIPDDLDYVACDYGVAGALEPLLATHDAVVDLAYASTPQTSFADPMADLLANVPAGVSMFEAARVAGWRGRILLASSGGTVYGVSARLPLAEDAPVTPVSPYGITKLAIERYAHLYRHLHGLDVVVVRPGNAYGAGQRPFTGQGFIATAMGAIAQRREVTVFGRRGAVRDYVHVSDIAAACVEVLARGRSGETYNIGTGHGRDNQDVLDALAPCVTPDGFPIRVAHAPERVFDVPANVLDCTKIRRECGWTPQVPFADGLASMWPVIRDAYGVPA